MSLTLHRGPAFGAARDAVRAAWRREGGLLVVRDRELASAALAGQPPGGVVLDREAVTLAGLRARVREVAGLGPARPPAPIHSRMALGELLGAREWPGWGASARAPGFLATLERALAELRAARVGPDVLARAAADSGGPARDLAALAAAAGEVRLASDVEWEAADAARGLAVFPPVAVDGFDDLAPPAWALLRALGAATEVRVALTFETGRRAYAARTARQEAWAAQADAVHDHGEAGGVDGEDAPGRPAALAALDAGLFEDRAGPAAPPAGDAVTWVGACGTRGMHRTALEAVLEAHRTGLPLHEAALVVPRLAEARDDLDRLLADWGVPARRASRARVLEAPLVLALTHLLAFAELDAGASGALDPMLGWLRSGYADAAPEDVDRFEVDMRRGARDGRGTLMARWGAAAIGPAARLAAATRSGPRAQLAALLGVGGDALRARAGGAEPTRADRRDLAALGALAGLAAGLGGDEAAEGEDGRPRGPLPPGELGRWIADLTFRDEEGPPAGLLVTDPAGVRGRRLSLVVLAGLDGDGLPPRPAPDAFLGPLRPRLPELPARAGGTDEHRLRFLSVVAAAGERLVLVRRTVDDEGREVAPSPYWTETLRLLGRPHDHLDRTTGADGELVDRPANAPTAREGLRRLAAAGSSVDGALADALARRRRPTGLAGRPFAGKPAFSVTSLEAYLRCPYGWLLDRVLKPRPIAEPFDPRAEGQIAHEALALLYGRMIDAGAGPCDAARLPAYLEALPPALDEALARRRPPEAGRVFDAFAVRVGRHLAGLLRREARLGPVLSPLRVEAKLNDTGLLEVTPPVALVGYADRVDGGEGWVVALDYKRSDTTFRPDDEEVVVRLQLPLYAEAAARAVGARSAGGLYLGINRPTAGGALRDDVAVFRDPPARAVVGADEWNRLLGESVRAAESAVTAIRAGTLTPPNGLCSRYCAHGDLWR